MIVRIVCGILIWMVDMPMWLKVVCTFVLMIETALYAFIGIVKGSDRIGRED